MTPNSCGWYASWWPRQCNVTIFQSPSPSREAQLVRWCLISFAGAILQAISSLGRPPAYVLNTRHLAHQFLPGVMSFLQGFMHAWPTAHGVSIKGHFGLYTLFLTSIQATILSAIVARGYRAPISQLLTRQGLLSQHYGHPCACHRRCAQNSWGYGPYHYFSDSEGPAGDA